MKIPEQTIAMSPAIAVMYGLNSATASTVPPTLPVTVVWGVGFMVYLIP